MTIIKCRFCSTPTTRKFADLGVSPVSNAFLKADHLNRMEPFYPLCAYVCETCLLVQLEDFESPENIFNEEYAYFSSYSDSWLEHARLFSEKAVSRLGLNENSFVVEIASNDGYLLQNFVKKGIPALGIEPSRNVADVAKTKGVESWNTFFGAEAARELVQQRKKPDLVIGNNVFAHVPALNDFVQGLKLVLADEGVITLEFPHLLCLMRECQFDTIYHEHFSYFSFLAVTEILSSHGLRVFDVERLSTHGGSLRIYAAHDTSTRWRREDSVDALLTEERKAGLNDVASYSAFFEQVTRVKRDLLEFLISAKRAGKSVVGYGAPAKGNTLLNFCGIGRDFIDYTVDRSLHKQGMFLPGTRLPIERPERIFETRPDYVLILPWNLQSEIAAQMSGISEWGGRFVVPIPELKVLD
ncbi:2-polyprenyl-3-methyl-5-hydroxy-6-metoxy-1,4-benzoquinol methylase [Bradyrhizobium sp. AZCC 1588]|uniref:class I SAM-dependent methyltransferase n=1 Tax=unclassified Bradyrhizobium TaxID=2631580 RepID=UPI002FF32894